MITHVSAAGMLPAFGDIVPNKPTIIAGGLVFDPDPGPGDVPVTIPHPPWSLVDWLKDTGTPPGLGVPDALVSLDMPSGGPVMMGFFGGHYVSWVASALTQSGTGFNHGAPFSGPVQSIWNFPAGFAPIDAAIQVGASTYLVKGREAITIGWDSSSQRLLAGPPQPLAILQALPDEMFPLDALLHIPDATRGADYGHSFAFKGGRAATWQMVGGKAGPLTLHPIIEAIPGLPIADLPRLVPRGLSKQQEANDRLTDYYRTHKESVDTAIGLASHIFDTKPFKRDLKALPWRKGPSPALKSRLNADVDGDSQLRAYVERTHEEGGGAVYVSFEASGSLFVEAAYGYGIGINTGDREMMALTSVGGGIGLSAGAQGVISVGYFHGGIETLPGYSIFCTGSIGLAAGAGLSIFLPINFSGPPLGFAASFGLGLDVGGDIGISHAWDMDEWVRG